MILTKAVEVYKQTSLTYEYLPLKSWKQDIDTKQWMEGTM